MSICPHGRGPGTCILCPDFGTTPPIPARTTNNIHGDPPVLEIVRTADTEITDPAAKTMLELAQAYAKAQDDLAAITATVRNTENLLRAARRDQVEAEKKCRAAQQALHAAVAPKVVRRKTKPVTQIARELETPRVTGPCKHCGGDRGNNPSDFCDACDPI